MGHEMSLVQVTATGVSAHLSHTSTSSHGLTSVYTYLKLLLVGLAYRALSTRRMLYTKAGSLPVRSLSKIVKVILMKACAQLGSCAQAGLGAVCLSVCLGLSLGAVWPELTAELRLLLLLLL